jgi:hypothetical protein
MEVSLLQRKAVSVSFIDYVKTSLIKSGVSGPSLDFSPTLLLKAGLSKWVIAFTPAEIHNSGMTALGRLMLSGVVYKVVTVSFCMIVRKIKEHKLRNLRIVMG